MIYIDLRKSMIFDIITKYNIYFISKIIQFVNTMIVNHINSFFVIYSYSEVDTFEIYVFAYVH